VRAAWKLRLATIPREQIEAHVAFTEFIKDARAPEPSFGRLIEDPAES
jgi:hypothetical protein